MRGFHVFSVAPAQPTDLFRLLRSALCLIELESLVAASNSSMIEIEPELGAHGTADYESVDSSLLALWVSNEKRHLTR